MNIIWYNINNTNVDKVKRAGALQLIRVIALQQFKTKNVDDYYYYLLKAYSVIVINTTIAPVNYTGHLRAFH